MKNKFIKLSYLFIFLFVFVHFLKDITQDILKTVTPLDLLGNVNEDLSSFPKIVQQGFMAIGYGSFLAEIFLILSIPFVLAGKGGRKLKVAIWCVVIAMIVYFITATLLDPRFR